MIRKTLIPKDAKQAISELSAKLYLRLNENFRVVKNQGE
jgi:hypothetical protein